VSTLRNVPVIDIAPFLRDTGKMSVARAVDRACRDIGFLVVGGHGVPADLIERTRAAGRAFFDLPLADKMRVARPAPGVARGYVGMEGESVARSRDPTAQAGDLNESLMIGPVDLPPDEYAFAPEAGQHSRPISGPPSPPTCGRPGPSTTARWDACPRP